MINLPHLLGDVELPVPVAHAPAVLVEALNVLDVGLAVQQSLRTWWDGVEQRLLSHRSRLRGRRPSSAVLPGPRQGRGRSWGAGRGRLGRSRGLLPVLHQPDPVPLLPLPLPLLALLLLVQLLCPLGVGLDITH